MEIPDASEFLEVLYSTPAATEYDPDIREIEVQVSESETLKLTYDLGARSVRLAKLVSGETEINIYREQVSRILLYSENGGRGIIVETDVPEFKSELRVEVAHRFSLVDTMLYVG